MEIKKVKDMGFIFTKYSFNGMILLLLLILSSCIGDITQYKEIGDTGYFLVDDDISNIHMHYRYSNGDFSESVKYKGFIKDVYWNANFIILKCTNDDHQTITNYCIIEQHARNNQYVPWEGHEYVTKQEFEEAKKIYGLDEEKMNYTDSHIPWSLHLFD